MVVVRRVVGGEARSLLSPPQPLSVARADEAEELLDTGDEDRKASKGLVDVLLINARLTGQTRE